MASRLVKGGAAVLSFALLAINSSGAHAAHVPNSVSADSEMAVLPATLTAHNDIVEVGINGAMERRQTCVKGPTYYVNEALGTRFGPNTCLNSCQCDGNRYCSRNPESPYGYCQGTARSRRQLQAGKCLKGDTYYVNEANNVYGPNVCSSSCDCDGNRFCVRAANTRFGVCQGVARLSDH